MGETMSETKFTPGPWCVGFESEMITSEVTERNPGAIAIVASHPPFAFGGAIALTWEIDNARLIAAAPDLYEALEAIMNDVEPTEFALASHIRKRAHVALAKARGETT